MTVKTSNIDDLSEFIKSQDQLLPYGRRTKTALIPPAGVEILDMSEVSGILEYEPSEYTFSAYAGTRIEEIDKLLSENNQFLPFDPPFINRGATLGGTVAANLSGSARYHFGGVRDFILGIQFLDGNGSLIRSGGKVVKNAAGFDLPKLMVGSLGSLGALVELSFKVFPRPEAYCTIISRHPALPSALEELIQLTTCPMEILCLDLLPTKNSFDLYVRIGGIADLFMQRIDALRKYIQPDEIISGESEERYWNDICEFRWVPEGTLLVKVPLTPNSVPLLEELLAVNGAYHRYTVGANVAWIAWPKSFLDLDRGLRTLNLSGLAISGHCEQIRLGSWEPSVFYQRIKQGLDPDQKWAEV
ncbi:MAG: FAD-binding protein [Chloroflexota bacterium]|nr:MAG: FAD-binding protein [Chloroflexota bacterium]